jgi:hypothetical protein
MCQRCLWGIAEPIEATFYPEGDHQVSGCDLKVRTRQDKMSEKAMLSTSSLFFLLRTVLPPESWCLMLAPQGSPKKAEDTPPPPQVRPFSTLQDPMESVSSWISRDLPPRWLHLTLVKF